MKAYYKAHRWFIRTLGYGLSIGMVLWMLVSITLMPLLRAQRSHEVPSYTDRVLIEHDGDIKALKKEVDLNDRRLVRLESAIETQQKLFWVICGAIAPTFLRDLRKFAELLRRASKEPDEVA